MGSAAQKVCLFQDRVEHRREVAGRGVDDLEDLGGRSPLFQSFARLVEEARVLHRDNGLGGEVLQQRDFFIRKGPNLLAGSNDAAKERVVLAEGNCQKCTEAAQFDRIPMRRLVDRRLIVDDAFARAYKLQAALASPESEILERVAIALRLLSGEGEPPLLARRLRRWLLR